MLRPLPPFRAKPLRKIRPLKISAAGGRKPIATKVKAQRLPIKLARLLPAAPSLKVLGRATHA